MNPAPDRKEFDSTGLDERELFGDLTDLSSEHRAASEPVRGPLIETPVPRSAPAANDPAGLEGSLVSLEAEGSGDGAGSWRRKAVVAGLGVAAVLAAGLAWWLST